MYKVCAERMVFFAACKSQDMSQVIVDPWSVHGAPQHLQHKRLMQVRGAARSSRERAVISKGNCHAVPTAAAAPAAAAAAAAMVTKVLLPWLKFHLLPIIALHTVVMPACLPFFSPASLSPPQGFFFLKLNPLDNEYAHPLVRQCTHRLSTGHASSASVLGINPCSCATGNVSFVVLGAG